MANPDLDPDLQRQRIEALTKRVLDLEKENGQLAAAVERLEPWAQELITALEFEGITGLPQYVTQAEIDAG